MTQKSSMIEKICVNRPLALILRFCTVAFDPFAVGRGVNWSLPVMTLGHELGFL
jgi:hypothetical protein